MAVKIGLGAAVVGGAAYLYGRERARRKVRYRNKIFSNPNVHCPSLPLMWSMAFCSQDASSARKHCGSCCSRSKHRQIRLHASISTNFDVLIILQAVEAELQRLREDTGRAVPRPLAVTRQTSTTAVGSAAGGAGGPRKPVRVYMDGESFRDSSAALLPATQQHFPTGACAAFQLCTPGQLCMVQ